MSDIDELLKSLELSYSVSEIDSFMRLIGAMGGAGVEPRYMHLARVLSDNGLVYYAPEIPSATLSPRGREFYEAGGFSSVAKSRKRIY